MKERASIVEKAIIVLLLMCTCPRTFSQNYNRESSHSDYFNAQQGIASSYLKYCIRQSNVYIYDMTIDNALHSSTVEKSISVNIINQVIATTGLSNKVIVPIDSENLNPVLLGGYRIKDNEVSIYWNSDRRDRNNYFVIQRRLSDQDQFESIDTIKATNAKQLRNDFNYKIYYLANYKDTIFYRLLVCDRKNRLSHTNTLAIEDARKHMIVWPETPAEMFIVDLNENTDVKSINVKDVHGSVVWSGDVRGQAALTLSGLAEGTYTISSLSASNKILDSRQIAVPKHN